MPTAYRKERPYPGKYRKLEEAAADAALARLERDYDAARLAALAQAGGREPA